MKLQTPMLLVFVGLAGAGSAAAAAFDKPAALAKARALRPAVSAGDAGRLWPEFGKGMREAMQDSTQFALRMGMAREQLGTIDSVLTEEAAEQNGLFVVRMNCRFTKAPAPLVVLMAFDSEGRVEGLAMRPADPQKEAPSAYLDYVTKTPLRLPFAQPWDVVWGGRTLAQNYHAAFRGQRFALDLLVKRDGATHRGDGKSLSDYYAYGLPILSPGAGVVVALVDGLPDQAPGAMDPAHAAGNHVLIDHGQGEFSLLAHLQPGSLRVKRGDRVKPGQLLGKCGNSGNTSEPHLHYHLQNSATPLEGDGLPAFFVDYVADGKRVARGEPVQGQRIAPRK